MLVKAQGNQQDELLWESCLVSVLKSQLRECINFKSAQTNGTKAGDRRLLFIPHSPGIYIALLLKDAQQIDRELDDDQDATMSNISAMLLKKQDSMKLLLEDETSTGAPVQKLHTENLLFLDLRSLSKSFQTILTQTQMLVIARVQTIERCYATEQENPYDLPPNTVYFQCQIHHIENIVGFESEDFGFTNYQISASKTKK